MGFNKATIDYLNSLPAVRRVGDGRIQYDPEFIDLFAALRHEGRGATEIFRAAGLAPEIVGRKRIEQCSSRWTGLTVGEPAPDAQRRLLPYPWDYAPSSNRLRADDPLKARIRRLEQRVARLEHLLCLDVIDAEGLRSEGDA
ncbi:hypothetical protein [uncultured Bifidobacterium sp.]|uniref:hypothetical protein n=1 Tax=uncultured Bifidobacterium sp. TaxID=165187 RepID=UPI0027DDAFFB|nr:hypothetical protein [uncultured Bifidobacterium sp.]